MSIGHILVKRSLNLNGKVDLVGAKNAVLPIMASLVLTKAESVITNVPNSADVIQMINLLEDLGAKVFFDAEKNYLKIDTSKINNFEVKPEIMNKMRASILVMGPLLARFGKAKVALPGGCLIGTRPIDLHLKGFKKMGVKIKQEGNFLEANFDSNSNLCVDDRIILEYPSVGATENIAMLAACKKGKTVIVNAALEPEVLDFLDVLKNMGAIIEFQAPATLIITGVAKLFSVKHKVIPDRLEAGALLLTAAISGGQIYLPDARFDHMDIFLEKLKEMGHEIIVGNEKDSKQKTGITLKATNLPQAVSFKTSPYPGFPTDLQAPMMTAQCVAQGVSVVEETVFENRLMHVKELQKMGAEITVVGNCATIRGVEELYGARVIASDIRASCALMLAGLVAKDQTTIQGIQHWRRGYDKLEDKVKALGAQISIVE